MALINEHFLKLQNNYLFSDIAKKVNSFKVTHPKDKIIRMGIGDVTQPLAPAVIEAMHKAVEEMASKDTFHGYGPEQGYPFLIDAIIKNDYASRGVFIEPSEVFISDGAKSDCGNIGDMLRHDNSIGVTDPVYPVYIDSNVMRIPPFGKLEASGSCWISSFPSNSSSTPPLPSCSMKASCFSAVPSVKGWNQWV